MVVRFGAVPKAKDFDRLAVLFGLSHDGSHG